MPDGAEGEHRIREPLDPKIVEALQKEIEEACKSKGSIQTDLGREFTVPTKDGDIVFRHFTSPKPFVGEVSIRFKGTNFTNEFLYSANGNNLDLDLITSYPKLKIAEKRTLPADLKNDTVENAIKYVHKERMRFLTAPPAE